MSSTDDLSKRANSRAMSEKSLGIEEQSMRIIESEVGPHQYSNDEWFIVKRVIHATADFDFANSGKIVFSPNAIQQAFQVFDRQRKMVTDVEMVLAGVNKNSIRRIGIQVMCNISNDKVIRDSQKLNHTRSALAMRYAASDIDSGIVIIGNAPTALYEIIKMTKTKLIKPALVIALPVGFVSAAASKGDLMKSGIEYVTNVGRKGGSSAVSSIINALMLLYLKQRA
ncbi:MAG TPA: precorrin-8X methylmutase [Nitrososphaeraceae archaeon]